MDAGPCFWGPAVGEAFDERWEYFAGDPEVEELLAGERGRRRPDFAIADGNRGYSVRRRPVPATPRRPDRRGPYAGSTAGLIVAYLRDHGRATCRQLAAALGVSYKTAQNALTRHRGRLFHVAGTVTDGSDCPPRSVWTLNPWVLRPPAAADPAADFSAGALLAGPTA
jgi:hypothetical protein